MPTIRQLPPDVVAKIAAGEVVERPSSVVKELVENSLDAGATRIDIDLEQGGTELIRVVDDGHGIPAEQLPLAFAPHATSKLESADDLFDLLTLGFRGEALASIAGVAQVCIQSRPAGHDTGSEVRCNNSSLSDVKPWGGATGTRIEVRQLFYSIPARKAFLKSHATELGHCSEVITRLALAHPTVHFVLKHNGKLVFELPASAGLRDRLGLFFGGDVQDALLDVDSGPNVMRVSGFVADPKCDRGNPKLQYLFVNGRWFRDRSLGHAVQEAYRGLLMTGRYAVSFLFLDVPPAAVDINVHPQKHEVRFREQSSVYSLVRSAVKARLLKANLVPQLQVPFEPRTDDRGPRGDEREYGPLPPPRWDLTPPRDHATPSLFSPRKELAEKTVPPWERYGESSTQGPRVVVPPEDHIPRTPPRSTEGGFKTDSPPVDPPSSSTTDVGLPTDSPVAHSFSAPEKGPGGEIPSGQPAPDGERLAESLPFALPALASGSALQVHDSYIVLETPDGMLVIDQHALHERILYEQLRRRIRDGKLEVQRLLIPEPIDLPAEQAALVLEVKDELADLGLEVSDFGGNTILLGSYPTLLSRRSPSVILQGVIDHLMTKDRPPSKEALLDHLLATMACKAAVKAGDRLTQEEIAHLLMLRQMAEDSHHCPHGRPTSLLFSRQQLDKQFGRT
ncbi:MAG: DNA mismatch repair endonuclease MutL [Fimbriiglobus sp.]|nr:DNA mismatch repair endonuclease MutL [Fimbriiglobus sp.]